MRPLGDLIVLELCRAGTPRHLRLAMAMAGRLVADLGARLISVVPPEGDALTAVPPFAGNGASTVQLFLTMGKEVLSSEDDSTFDQAVEALIALKPAAVIVAEGDPDLVRFARAGIAAITLATWPEGSEDDRAGAPINGFGIMAAGGILDIIGDPDREPLRLGGHQISYAAGLSAFTALMAAVAQRDLDGRVLDARISLIETAVWMNWKAVVGAAEGDSYPTRRGDKAGFPVLRCKDGWVALVFTPMQFDRVRAMFPDLPLVDPSALPHAQRATALTKTVAPWLAERTRAEIYAEARQHGVPLGPVYTPAELLDDEQYLARDFLVGGGSVDGMLFPRSPMTWNGDRLPDRASRKVTLADVVEPTA